MSRVMPKTTLPTPTRMSAHFNEPSLSTTLVRLREGEEVESWSRCMVETVLDHPKRRFHNDAVEFNLRR